MSSMLDLIKKEKVIPVAVIEDVSKSVPLAEALITGGLNSIEVTFLTEAAEEAIRLIREQVPEMLVGAGTIYTVEQCRRALDAGAQFIVSPGLAEEVVKMCREVDIMVIPGCVTPTEVIKAIGYDLSVVKFFPAEQYGGIATINSLSQVFGDISFMPTGGISLDNMKAYLSNDSVCACGGSFMVAKNLISEGDFEKITELTKQAVAIRDEI